MKEALGTVLVLKDESRQVVFDSIEFRKKLQESLL